MKLRIALIISVVLVLFVYVGWRLSDSLGSEAATALMIFLFASLFFFRPVQKLKNRKLRRILVSAIHMEMGFLSFLLTWIFLRDLIFIPLGYASLSASEFAYSPRGTFIVIALALASLLAGLAIANAGPWVVRVKVPVKNLPDDLEGFTIAQLSDMHIGPTTPASVVENIVKKTLLLEPDLIALTGDIGDGPLGESAAAVDKLRPLAAKANAYYVTGNHEYYWNGPEWVNGFARVGLKPLLNSYAYVQKGSARVKVIGTPDPTAKMLGAQAGPNVELAARTPDASVSREATGVRQGDFNLLLAHQPGISGEALKNGINLQLSGHTHAGQFFPWTLVVKRVHEFSQGLGRTGSLWVYVNPGTGSWGPQVRLGTKTEITLLTLTKES